MTMETTVCVINKVDMLVHQSILLSHPFWDIPVYGNLKYIYIYIYTYSIYIYTYSIYIYIQYIYCIYIHTHMCIYIAITIIWDINCQELHPSPGTKSPCCCFLRRAMVARTVAAGPVLRVQQPPAMILTGRSSRTATKKHGDFMVIYLLVI